MEELLFTNYDKKKIAILKILNRRIGQHTRISVLVEELEVSYHGIVALLEEMQHEMMLLFGLTLCEKGFKVIPFQQPVCESRYFKYLAEQSMAFQFLLTSLTQPQTTIETFAAQHYVSRSTVNRSLKKLKDYLKEKEIQLNISKIKLSGSEIDIQLFLVHMLLMIDPKRIEVLFRDFRKEAGIMVCLRQQNLLSNYQHVVLIIFIIARLRYTQGYRIQEVKGFDAFYPSLDHELNDYLHGFINDEQQFSYHRHYLKGLIFFLLHYTDRSAHQDGIIDHFSEHIKKEQPLFAQLSDEIAQSLDTHYAERKANGKKCYEVERIIFLILYFTFATNGRPLNFWWLDHVHEVPQRKQSNLLEKDIRKIINKYARRVGYEWVNSGKANLPSYLAFFIFPYYQHHRMEKLRIGLLPTLDFSTIQRLSFFLEHVKFIEFGIANNAENSFDFYLADSEKALQSISSTQIIPFHQAKIEDMSALFEVLWEKYLKKNNR